MSQFHELAVTLVGDTCVGKTMMIKTYVNGKCHQHKIPTIGIDLSIKKLLQTNNNRNYKVLLYDTTGSQRFVQIISPYIKKAIGIIICFSYGDKQSLYNVIDWYNLIKKTCNKNIQIIVSGNIYNNHIEITKEEVDHVLGKLNLECVDTHISSFLSIQKTFSKLVFKIDDCINNDIIPLNSIKLSKDIIHIPKRHCVFKLMDRLQKLIC
jgi:small GTP-binding protein